jgi:hypothetical protein
VGYQALFAIQFRKKKMGKIREEVLSGHLVQHPGEREIVAQFVSGFDIVHATARKAFGKFISIYTLEPDKYIKETFGFNFALALFVPHDPKVTPSTMQAVAQFLNEEPLRGRVDRLSFLFFLKDGRYRQTVVQYTNEFAFGWIPIFFTRDDQDNAKNAWGLRNIVAAQIFTRDLFDQQLPIRSDLSFFGREPLIFDLSDAITKGQNRGLFGLRKTGKTSVLFKLLRQNKDGRNIFIYLDCKAPRIRNLHWKELLNYIAGELLSASGNDPKAFSDYEPIERIERAISLVKQKARICLIFDEIEFISFFPPRDEHWKEEFIEFWQTLWSLQSLQGNICYIIAGVNAKIAETDVILAGGGPDGIGARQIQNPLFGIVPAQYLKGLEVGELRRMIRTFGKRMGLDFSEEAIGFLHEKYGGHPLLTREACSYIHSLFEREHRERPILISKNMLAEQEANLDTEIEFYFRHILNELEEFYPDEYEVLCMGATGQKVDFTDFARERQFSRHLTEYGIIEVSADKRPTFLIECLQSYLKHETARRENLPEGYRLIEGARRKEWLSNRASSLIKQFRHLNTLIQSALKFYLFPDGTISSPEDFMKIACVTDQASLVTFLVTANRLISDSVDRAGTKQGFKNFFFSKMATELPNLQDALLRLRCYRHAVAHDNLYETVKNDYRRYVAEDFGEYKETFTKRECMIIQQIILDEVFLAIQDTTAKLSN